MLIKDMVDEINIEIWNLHPSIVNLKRAIDENYAKYISEDSLNKVRLENRVKALQEAKAKLQAICEHVWDDGQWEDRDHYYICKICGACKGDC